MSCMPGHISDRMSTTAYKRHMEGTGLSHRECQRHQVECSECGVELAASSLQHHRRTIHGLLTDTADDNVDHPGHQDQLYHISFPKSSWKIGVPWMDVLGWQQVPTISVTILRTGTPQIHSQSWKKVQPLSRNASIVGCMLPTCHSIRATTIRHLSGGSSS